MEMHLRYTVLIKRIVRPADKTKFRQGMRIYPRPGENEIADEMMEWKSDGRKKGEGRRNKKV